MPIRPENRKFYSRQAGWPRIRGELLARAKNRCERCGVPNGMLLSSGVRVVLTIAHLDQDPSNNDASNLQALCQRCHLNHDRPFNVPKQAETRRRRKDAARPLLRMAGEAQ